MSLHTSFEKTIFKTCVQAHLIHRPDALNRKLMIAITITDMKMRPPINFARRQTMWRSAPIYHDFTWSCPPSPLTIDKKPSSLAFLSGDRDDGQMLVFQRKAHCYCRSYFSTSCLKILLRTQTLG